MLIQLRYLAIGGYLTSIPQSIANLRKLETLVVKGLRGKIVLPNTIWRMTSLRHLHVSIHVTLDSDDEEELEDCFVLENLVSFSRLSLPCGGDSEWTMKRLPNLRKLSCIIFQRQDSSANHNQFPSLNLLCHLESLKIFYYGYHLNNGEFNLPLTLKQLTLSNFHLPWSCISAIGRLPNLEVLKLRSEAFVGRTWDMVEEEFLNLRFLSLDTLDIVQWNASCDHLPRLETLVLQNCRELRKIPPDFADISTLEIIEVNWCGVFVEISARHIREATGDVKVVIRSLYWRP
nr:putative late blight resistance protein homolog R1A-3 [Coffea arabica]